MSAIPFVPDPDRIQRAARLVRPLMAAHRFSTKGMEHVPRRGGCLMVVHHSLATYDGFLLGLDIWDRTGRLGRGLGDDRIFQTPRLAELAQDIGLVPASPTAGRELLDAGELVGVAPGGMWEALRPSGAAVPVGEPARLPPRAPAQVPMLLAAVLGPTSCTRSTRAAGRTASTSVSTCRSPCSGASDRPCCRGPSGSRPTSLR